MILLMYDPVADHFQNLRRIAPEHEFFVAHSEEEAAHLIVDAEIVLGNWFFLQSLPYAKKLRWMQSHSVGVDVILAEKQQLMDKGVILTCVRGIYDTELAEHTITLLLALLRKVHLLRDDQLGGRWQRHRLRTLHGTKCMILGWGSLAKEIARLIGCFGGIVSAVRNQKYRSQEGEVKIYGKEDWQTQLPNVDALIMCLPKTLETHHFVDEAVLSQLPPTAFVVNIGRGGTLDDEALLRMVGTGKLAGAALDVFEIEPLPASHPMWAEPRVLVTPHVGRSVEGPAYRWQTFFEENLARYIRKEPLYNVVNYKKGY